MTQPYDQPAGPVPVPVHVTGISAEVTLGSQAPRGRVRTRFLTETVDDTNPVRPLLPDDPGRLCAYLQVTGGDVILCGSQADAQQSPPQGSVLPKADTAPWPVRGQGAMWAAQAVPASTCIISVSADYGLRGA